MVILPKCVYISTPSPNIGLSTCSYLVFSMAEVVGLDYTGAGILDQSVVVCHRRKESGDGTQQQGSA